MELTNTINKFVDTLNNNQGVSQWIMAFVALTALYYSIKEFILKRRPYINIDLIINLNNKDDVTQGWNFALKIINKGTYPSKTRIENAVIHIGDDTYPTYFKANFFLYPGENSKLFPIGNINAIGINKIKGHEYHENRVEIEVRIISTEIGNKKYKYSTKSVFLIDVTKSEPIVTLISEDLT